MIKKIDRNVIRKKRAYRARLKIDKNKPKMVIYRGRNLYVQVVKDGITVASSSSIDRNFKDQKLSSNIRSAEIIGRDVAEKALKKGVTEIVFDRSGYKYTGAVKALADAARAAGLKF